MQELVARVAALNASPGRASKSPFGKSDERGMLNLADARSARRVLGRLDPYRIFDLAVDYFVGMPSWTASGDLGYQIWLSHTPSGTLVDDPLRLGAEHNAHVSYSGDSIAMYNHCGTHVDTLNHFGYDGEIWNRFRADRDLGSRHWRVAGADRQQPIIARGVMLDVARLHEVDVLPASYGIGVGDIRNALKRQRLTIRRGDVILIRTGRMGLWPDSDAFIRDEPGLTLEGARFLAERGAIMIGADNVGVEQMPSEDPANWQPVHTYLLAEAGVPLVEVVNLQELSEASLYEFAFIGACIKLRGATGAPIRPIAIPLGRG